MTTQTLEQKLNSNVAPTRGRFTLTRETYIQHLPEDKVTQVFEAEMVVAYSYISRRGYASVMIFTGRGNAPSVHKAYRTTEQRDQAVLNVVSNIQSDMQRKVQRKAERSQPHTLEVGSILVSSWGYDQTNIDYYQVTKLVGTTMVEMKQISASVSTCHGTYQDVAPVKNSFFTPRFEGDTHRTETLRKKVNPVGNSVSINSFATAYPWNGRPQTETHPMFGR